MYFAELNVPQNHVYLFKPHSSSRCGDDGVGNDIMSKMFLDRINKIDRIKKGG